MGPQRYPRALHAVNRPSRLVTGLTRGTGVSVRARSRSASIDGYEGAAHDQTCPSRRRPGRRPLEFGAGRAGRLRPAGGGRVAAQLFRPARGDRGCAYVDHLHARRPAVDHHPTGRAARLPGRIPLAHARPHDTRRPDLHELGARAAGSGSAPAVRDQQLHLPLLHGEHRGRRLQEPRVPVHPARQQRHQPRERAGVDRPHLFHGREPQRGRPEVRPGRLPLRLRGRRRLRLGQPFPMCRRQLCLARP